MHGYAAEQNPGSDTQHPTSPDGHSRATGGSAATANSARRQEGKGIAASVRE